MHHTQGTCSHVVAEHARTRGDQPLGHIPSLAKGESGFMPRMVYPLALGRAVRPVAARARAVRAQAESGQAQEVRRPVGLAICRRRRHTAFHGPRGSAFSVRSSSVHLARMPSKCLPGKSAPSNPSIEGTAKQLRCSSAPHVKR
jgi:hypothetical protein